MGRIIANLSFWKFIVLVISGFYAYSWVKSTYGSDWTLDVLPMIFGAAVAAWFFGFLSNNFSRNAWLIGLTVYYGYEVYGYGSMVVGTHTGPFGPVTISLFDLITGAVPDSGALLRSFIFMPLMVIVTVFVMLSREGWQRRLSNRFRSCLAGTKGMIRSNSAEFGAAQWEPHEALRKAQADRKDFLVPLTESGIITGALAQAKTKAEAEMILPNADILKMQPLKEGHVLVMGGNGSGKSAGFNIPSALSWRDSLVVTDFKGEIRRATARYRSTVLGQQIYWIDSFRPSESHGIDVLDWLDVSSDRLLAGIDTVAQSLIVDAPNSSSGGTFFIDQARKLVRLSLLVLFDVYARSCVTAAEEGVLPPARPTIIDAYRWLMRPATALKTDCGAVYAEAAELLASTDDDRQRERCYAIAGLSSDLPQLNDETFSNIHATVSQQLSWLTDRNLARLVSTSSFPTSAFTAQKTTVYLNLPITDVGRAAGFVRIIVATILSAIERHYLTTGSPTASLFLLDEAGQLGNFDVIYDKGGGITYYRGLGVVFAFSFQDIETTEAKIRKGIVKSIQSNSVACLWMRSTSETDAEFVSKALGNMTMELTSYSGSTNGARMASVLGAGSGQGESVSTSVQQRPLMYPQEISTMPEPMMLITRPGLNPLKVLKPYYFLIPTMNAACDPKDGPAYVPPASAARYVSVLEAQAAPAPEAPKERSPALASTPPASAPASAAAETTEPAAGVTSSGSSASSIPDAKSSTSSTDEEKLAEPAQKVDPKKDGGLSSLLAVVAKKSGTGMPNFDAAEKAHADRKADTKKGSDEDPTPEAETDIGEDVDLNAEDRLTSQWTNRRRA
jgi:type IV secretion system protein VirD4